MRFATSLAIACWLIVAGPVLAEAPGGALPPSIASAGVTQAEWDAVRRAVHVQAQRAGVAEAALLAAAEAAGSNFARTGHFSALTLQQAIFNQLATQAEQIVELQHRLEALAGDADAGTAHIYADARTALDEGRLTDASALLAQVEQRDLAAIQQADAEARQRRIRLGETISVRGRLAYIQGDYFTAAAFLRRAAETVPQSETQWRWIYVYLQAHILAQRGELFDEPASSREAIRILRDEALPLSPRATRPSQWAVTENDMGIVLELLGERGDDQALRDARAAFQAALEVDTRERNPGLWAVHQGNLGTVLETLGRRGDVEAMRQAVATYRNALEVQTSGSHPDEWAANQNNLGDALAALGERGEGPSRGLDFLHEALAAYHAALQVDTVEHSPTNWARDQNNLGSLLLELGRRGDENALRDAFVTFNQVLVVQTRTRAPAEWASAQYNLGNVLIVLGERGSGQALQEAAAAYRASLEVWTPENDATRWANAQHALGDVYYDLGERGDRNAFRAAVGAYRAALEVRTRENNPSGWASTQNNLGNALEHLGEEGNGQALDGAVDASRAALEVWTRQSDPEDWAAAQANLGNALLLRGYQRNQLGTAAPEAIAAYRAAMEVQTRESDLAAWAIDQYNLARAFGMEVQRGDRAQLADAMSAARAALDGYQQTHNSRGTAQTEQLISVLEAMR